MTKKSCPAILECDECMWWREFRHKNNQTGQVEYFHRCGIEIIIEWMLRAENSIDGMQTAVNESRNRSFETKQAVMAFGHAAVKTLEGMKKIQMDDSILIEEAK